MKDYSKSIEPIRFKINDDVFEAVPSLPGRLLKEFAKITAAAAKVDENDQEAGLNQLDQVYDFLDKVLLPKSAERFAERMVSLTEPIDFKQAMEVFADLLREYTGSETETETEEKAAEAEVDLSSRPTLEALPSSDTASRTGTASVDEPLSGVSTSEQLTLG